MKNLAVGVSGKGTNLQAMIDAKIPISLVFADRTCLGTEIAKKAGIPTEIVARPFRRLENDLREVTTRKFMWIFEDHKIDFIAMAGFMMIFHSMIFDRYRNAITNLHPSLLPAFKGEHAVRDALAAGVKVTGTTVHYATEILDEGPIIAQEPVRVLAHDTEESLHERIKKVERTLYPRIVNELICST